MDDSISTDYVFETQETTQVNTDSISQKLDIINQNIYTGTITLVFIISIIIGIQLGKVLRLWK